MPKFKITLEENVWYELIVEANSDEEAAQEAEAVFVQTDISRLPTRSRERSWVCGERAPDDAVLTDTRSAPTAGSTQADLIAALQWLLDDMDDAGETHDSGVLFDSVENAAAHLVAAGGSLAWYSHERAKAYLAKAEKPS